jgi:hypothetical protein
METSIPEGCQTTASIPSGSRPFALHNRWCRSCLARPTANRLEAYSILCNFVDVGFSSAAPLSCQSWHDLAEDRLRNPGSMQTPATLRRCLCHEHQRCGAMPAQGTASLSEQALGHQRITRMRERRTSPTRVGCRSAARMTLSKADNSLLHQPTRRQAY